MNVFVTDVGYGALVIGLLIAAYTAVAAASGAMKGYPELLRSARNGVLVAFGLTTISSAALVYAFFSRDFGVKYVTQYSSRDLDPIFTFAAWWAGQAGSLLLWAWVLAMFAMIIVVQNKEQNRRLLPYATSIMMALLAFFLLVMIFAANPFERLPVTPADGEGLNPLLENFGMFFHPTTLYIGYVGFTVPFAFAMAALITRRLDDQWIRSTRRWTLFAWFFLGLGNLFGAQWAYVELGWGGYWGWDPVESASFMPWLTGTAYLHSVMIQQRRGMLKVWNMLLIIITFSLSIFGTLLTRSGILSSVHTFAQSAVGPMFMALIGVLLVFSIGLLLDRLALLKSENEIDSFVSREASFLLNNLLLVGAAFAVFWGTVFPLISEAVRGVKITVGPPFYNQVSAPIFLGMVILMGICPLIGWRKASTENLIRNFLYPLAGAILVAAALYFALFKEWYAILAFWALAFVMLTITLEFFRGARARHRATGQDYLSALGALIWANKPRYGGYIVHIGVIVLAIGVAASQFYSASVESNLQVGDSLSIKDYKVTFLGLSQYQTQSRHVISAAVEISQPGQKPFRMNSEKLFHKEHENPTTEVGIRTTALEDLYLILNGWENDGSASFKVLVNPMVVWIWIGGVILLVGTAVAFWPDARESRRFVAQQAVARREAVVPGV
ncbi:MAG: heme lyase CcmF/NrfE family subunit [Chloroflexi bacterium]|nr:heme lyase CcmF/NrfE family subunit [Chloroflexota bacterium]